MEKFHSGSPVHILSLAVCVLAVIGYAFAARAHRSGKYPWLTKVLAFCCILTWIINTAWHCFPFKWETSLPLFYCNWANLLAAAALLTRNRLVDGVLYYWACGLTIWAFITPTLEYGPAKFGFWVFWGYHICIALAICHLLVANRFRPTIADWIKTSMITIAYGLGLVAINVTWGWNYAFLGKSSPNVPTPIDVLGPWPLRLVWIAGLAVILFLLLTVPWLRKKRIEGSEKTYP